MSSGGIWNEGSTGSFNGGWILDWGLQSRFFRVPPYEDLMELSGVNRVKNSSLDVSLFSSVYSGDLFHQGITNSSRGVTERIDGCRFSFLLGLHWGFQSFVWCKSGRANSLLNVSPTYATSKGILFTIHILLRNQLKHIIYAVGLPGIKTVRTAAKAESLTTTGWRFSHRKMSWFLSFFNNVFCVC